MRAADKAFEKEAKAIKHTKYEIYIYHFALSFLASWQQSMACWCYDGVRTLVHCTHKLTLSIFTFTCDRVRGQQSFSFSFDTYAVWSWGNGHLCDLICFVCFSLHCWQLAMFFQSQRWILPTMIRSLVVHFDKQNWYSSQRKRMVWFVNASLVLFHILIASIQRGTRTKQVHFNLYPFCFT